MNSNLTYERASDLFNYCPIQGLLTWRRDHGRRIKAGQLAGSPDVYGYLRVQVDGRAYKVHRVAWLLTHKVWPANLIDHRNHVRSDNRISNLREADARLNVLNLVVTGSGKVPFLGVTKSGKRYQAYLMRGGRNERLGTFDTPEEAHATYMAAKMAEYPHVFQ